VLPADATLTAAELREVAHAQVGSKLRYVCKPRVKETLLLLWSWGLALLEARLWWAGATAGVAAVAGAQDEVVGGTGADGDGVGR